MTAEWDTPVVVSEGSVSSSAPLVVFLHGRGRTERDIISLAGHLPPRGAQYVAVRAPIAEGSGFAWFANRGIGRPIADSLSSTMEWFGDWLGSTSPPDRPVFLVGFSGGAAFAGGLILNDPGRFAGAALLCGTLPWNAGVPTTPGRLADLPVFVAQGEHDAVIPRELLDRTWDYLLGESGASTVARRDPVAHEISPEARAGLAEWLGEHLHSFDGYGGTAASSAHNTAVPSEPRPSPKSASN